MMVENRKLFGLQKLTLQDYPGKVACVMFTTGCDFRCPFCHNAGLVFPERTGGAGLFTLEDVLGFLKKRSGMLDGVCVSGGEPMMSDDIFDILAQIKALGYEIKLDTNGSYPARLKRAVAEGLVDYVAMDIKNSPAKYAAACGLTADAILEPVRESAAFLMSGAVPYEFRTTVVKPLHETADFRAIGEWLRGAAQYKLQRYQDSGDILGDAAQYSAASDAEMAEYLAAVQEFIPAACLRGE